MDELPEFFEGNRRWAADTEVQHPGFFERLAEGQAPRCLWIGCADSRVPPTQVAGLLAGDLFVHRNIANVIMPTDPSLLAVVEYGVEALKIPHLVVCGHYGCGGVNAALKANATGTVAEWLRPVRSLAAENGDELNRLVTDQQRWDRLCELNVLRQVRNLAGLPVVRTAWSRGQPLEIHSWIFQLRDGALRTLAEPIRGA